MATYPPPGNSSFDKTLRSAGEVTRFLIDLTEGPRLAPLLAALGKDARLALVGGTVRDAFFSRETNDLDIAHALEPQEALRRLTTAGISVYETGLHHGTVMAVHQGEHIELTTFRGPVPLSSPEALTADLALRDFTINAIAFDTQTEQLVDPSGGIADLGTGILRAVGDPTGRFREDPLRVLRLIRFGPAQGLSVEQSTQAAARDIAPLLSNISAERIRQELERILLAPDPAAAFRLMLELGILTIILPELLPSVGFEQNEFHIHDVFEHTLWVISRAQPDRLLRWAALFHDIAKPASLTVDDEGRRHFYRHEDLGAEIAAEVLRRFKASTDDIRGVSTLVKYHMRPMDCGPAAVRRLLRDLGELFDTWRALKNADSPPVMAEADFIAQCARFDELVHTEREAQKSPSYGTLALDGYDLIKLGIAPGPAMGKLLKELEDYVIEEPARNTKELLEQFVRERTSG